MFMHEGRKMPQRVLPSLVILFHYFLLGWPCFISTWRRGEGKWAKEFAVREALEFL